MSTRQYTDKQKAAYYKKLAGAKTIRGRGAYKTRRAPAKRAPVKRTGHSPLWGVGGGLAASALGLPAPLGVLGGNLLGGAFRAITGHGDYVQNSGREVVNNSLYTQDPMMTPIINPYSGPGDMFRRSEYIRDITTSPTPNTFSVTSYKVNPGLESTFEWLSQIAANYEEYQILGLYFEYRSMSADALNSVNTALGQVIMAANYNSASPNFSNKQTMENYQGGISAKPSSNMRFFLECAKNQSVLDELYIRAGAVPTGQDQRMYDLANFQIATNGFQGTNVNVGELWVCYEVVLRKPKLYSAIGLYNIFSSSSSVYSNVLPITTGLGITDNVNNNLEGLAFTGTTISFDAPNLPQSYQLNIFWLGGVAAVIAYPTIAGQNGLTVVSNTQVVPNGQTSTGCGLLVNVSYKPQLNTTNSKATLQIGTVGTLPATPIQVNYSFYQLPNTVLGI